MRQAGGAEAQQHYEAVMLQRPLTWAKIGLARALEAEGKFDDACTLLRNTIAESTMAMHAYDQLARMLAESNKHTDAMEVLHKAGEQSPGTLGRLRTLTSLAIGAGQNDVAEQVMTNALKVNKHSPLRDVGDFALLSRALLNQNKSAAEALTKANAGDLTNVPLDVALTVAEANLVLGREAEAHNLIKQAIQNNPDGSNLMQKVMTALGGKNKAEQAAAIIAASQREIIQLNNEGVRKAEAGQFDQAIALLSSAADRLPNNLQIVGNAALALAQHMVRHGVDSERLNICLRYRNSLARQSPEDPKLRQIDTNLQRLKR
jgi:tetratricopeptide (TPR) repeat protein